MSADENVFLATPPDLHSLSSVKGATQVIAGLLRQMPDMRAQLSEEELLIYDNLQIVYRIENGILYIQLEGPGTPRD